MLVIGFLLSSSPRAVEEMAVLLLPEVVGTGKLERRCRGNGGSGGLVGFRIVGNRNALLAVALVERWRWRGERRRATTVVMPNGLAMDQCAMDVWVEAVRLRVSKWWATPARFCGCELSSRACLVLELRIER